MNAKRSDSEKLQPSLTYIFELPDVLGKASGAPDTKDPRKLSKTMAVYGGPWKRQRELKDQPATARIDTG